MFMLRVNEMKRGDLVDYNGESCIVRKIEARNPSARGASTLYKVRFEKLLSGQKNEISLKGDVTLAQIVAEKIEVQFSYRDSGQYFFMDLIDFNQYVADESMLSDKLDFLTEGLENILAVIVDGTFVGIDLPNSVVLTIDDTSPGIKGASANARTKRATLSTGMVVQVPEHIEKGERIKVNTSNGQYMSRA